MIIGIAGRMGSGKDTVGSIIQYLTLGEEFSKTNGDIIADMELDWYCAKKSKFQIKKFAGKLKQVASLITGVPVEMWEDQDFKQGRMPYGWGMTYREFLQKLGTEAMREGLHEDVWVNALFADYKPTTQIENAYYKSAGIRVFEDYPLWIITDMRFPNEMKAVELRKGITIRVVRPDMNSLQSMIPAHASETALDDCEFDYHIDNSGTIEDLIENVREILVNEKLL